MTELDATINALTKLFTKNNIMTPAMLALILSLVEEAIAVTPGVIDDLKLIFNNPDPTPADWEALRAKVLAKSYADYVPASALPSIAAVRAAAPAPANVVALSTPVPPPPGATPLASATPAPAAAAAPSAALNGAVDANYKPGS